jgi:small subunit ribosomal protein S8
MSNRYILGDVVVRLKVGMLGHFSNVYIPRTTISMDLVKILYQNGLIRGFYLDFVRDQILVYLKYHLGNPVLKDIKIVSRPGKRAFWTLNKLSLKYNLRNFSGFYILSTSRGLLTSHQCLLSYRIGGEVLLKIKY